ncbi:MAG: STAS domain-containing protein [Oscillochloris sp.]|nr:STAS domain-containing protein [Oscillochloris sp.]
MNNDAPRVPCSDTSLDALVNILPDPCALIGTDGTIRTINAAWHDAFVQTGLDTHLLDACTAMFQWRLNDRELIQHDIREMLGGSVSSCRFEDVLTEPPERWFANTIVAHQALAGGLFWQAHDVSAWRITEEETARIWYQIRDALESVSDGFALYDNEDRLVFCNQRYRKLYPKSADLMVPGKKFAEIVQIGVKRGQYPDAIGREDEWAKARIRQHQACEMAEIRLVDDHWIRSIDQRTNYGGIVCIRSDISYMKQAEVLSRQSEEQAEVIRIQASLLAELSTPLLRISDRVVAMPLIGTLDSMRASLVVDTLLHAVEGQRVEVAILDITGVPIVDTQMANLLLQCARSVQLLGARMVLTGIRPDVAQTMVSLGIDLEGVVTRADLMGGIAYALRRR